MTTQKQFSTCTDQRWYAFYTALIFIILAIAGGLGMWFWLQIPGPALLVSGTCLLLMVVMGILLARQRNIELNFTDDELHIAHLNGQNFEIYDIPASDFVCSQNFLEKKKNVGRIKVKNTMFYFYGVQNYSETCRYIRENFPNR